MNIQDAISKAARLLRLANSDNPHEAASAAAKAQDIIDRYQISAALLELEGKTPDEPHEDIGYFKQAPLDGKVDGRLSSWRSRLAITVADANGCKCLFTGGAVNLVGRPSDAETVRYLYAWLANETERLADKHGKGCGRPWRENFRHGVIDTLGQRLRAQRAATADAMRAEAGAPSAIVLVNQALAKVEARKADAQAWVDKNIKVSRSRAIGGGGQFNPGARAMGRKAGHEVALSRARGALGGGAV